MPVDFLPLILLILTAVGLVVMAVWVVSRPLGKRRRAAVVAGVFLVAPWPLLYVWVYHRAEIAYSSAASRSDPEAQYRLGFSYLKHHEGAPYNPFEGRRLLEQAAEAGHAKARMTLGCYLLSGVSMPSDRERALALFDQAAQSIPDAAVIAREVRAHGYDVDHPKGVAAAITIRWTMERQ